MYSSDAFHYQHARLRGAVADFACLAVLGRGAPDAGLLEAGKLDHHDALRLPVAVEHLRLAAAGEESAAVGGDGSPRELAVFLDLHGIGHGHFHDHVRRHDTSGFVFQASDFIWSSWAISTKMPPSQARSSDG